MGNQESTETLADRLNAEPIIFRGSTSTELLTIVFCGAVFWLPLSLFIAILLGSWSLMMGITGFGIILTTYLGTTLFQHIKRGRPDFYYQHLVIIKLNNWGFRKAQLVLKTTHWSQGRE
jgi:conjugative transfer region protein (TIGR03750 family)